MTAKTLFEWVQAEHPGAFDASHWQTYERKVRTWRVRFGPGQAAMFLQVHDAGGRTSSDFTAMDDLAVTIQGEPFDHLVYHFVLLLGPDHRRPRLRAAEPGGDGGAVHALGRAIRTWHRDVDGNLPFSQWTQIFKDPMTTAAAIDRLVHHSVILELNVASYRLDKAQTSRKAVAEPANVEK